MDSRFSVPTGSQVSGRVINSQGKSLDDKADLHPNTPLVSLDAPVSTSQKAGNLLETGIKAVDLLAPLSIGGTFALTGPYGAGRLVVLEELMHLFGRRRNGYLIGLSMDEQNYQSSELIAAIEEMQIWSRTTLLFEPLTDSVEQCLQLVRVGSTIAAEMRSQGHDVLLFVDTNLVTRGLLMEQKSFRDFVAAHGITTILLRKDDERASQDELEARQALDGQIVTSADLAKQKIWPAIDRQLTSSRFLQSPLVIPDHRQITSEARQLLQLLASDPKNVDPHQLQWAQQLQFFLTQPFFVAELFNGVPGEQVSLSRMLAACQEIIVGRYEDLSIEAFKFGGDIDQVLARAKRI